MKVLVVLGDGGHTKQILRLLDLLGDKYEYVYLMDKADKTSESKISFPGQIYRVNRPSDKYNQSYISRITWLLRNVWQELIVAIKVRPQVILSMGAGLAVPISVIGRLAGTKVIHVETASRVYALSTTGKLMYRIAHLFFVQWESHLANYPRAIYAGRLL